MKIQGIINLNFIQKCKNKAHLLNKTYFKSSIKKDTFEISSANFEITRTKKQIEELEKQIEELEKRLQQALLDKSQIEEKKKTLEEESEKRPFNRQLKSQIKRTQRQIEKKDVEIRRLLREIRSANSKQNAYNKYLAKLIEAPSISYLYNPDVSYEEKNKQAQKSGHIYNLADFATQLDVKTDIILGWQKAGVLNIEETGNKNNEKFIDINDETNKALLERIQSELIDSEDAYSLTNRTNIPPYTLIKMIHEGKIKIVGLDSIPKGVGVSNIQINKNHPLTQKTLTEYNKLHPKKSEKYFKYDGDKPCYVPIQYLAILGYGDVAELREMVRKNNLPGKTSKVKTKSGEKVMTFVDIRPDNFSERTLKYMRRHNPSVVEFSNWAKELNISKEELRKAILSDKAKIIPEFIFAEDMDTVLINKKHPTNIEFMKKIQDQKGITSSVTSKEET